jgi:hypothetical protein
VKHPLAALLLSAVCLGPASVSNFPQDSASRQNFNNCRFGYPGCDPSTLTDTERSQVQQAAHQRNFNNCRFGYRGCDPSTLTDTERPQVQQAAHQRNFNNCRFGYPGCDPSTLTDTERPQVQQAAHQRNFNNCRYGYPGCNLSALSDDEKSQLARAASAGVSEPRQDPTAIPQNRPRYYTNKDGIRVQSPTYYNSQPVGATAQCTDGTYSFSLNHRGTCSHHGGVSKWIDRTPISSTRPPAMPRRSFAGYACTSNCSGHEAGYRWAEEHGIDDTDACDTAGDRSNSPSFAEGCRAFVEGEAEPDDSDDSGSMNGVNEDDDSEQGDDPETLNIVADQLCA